jgi:putative redox protein
MTVIDSVYQGGLRCKASHGPSGTELETDAPTDNQGKGERFSPTDLVATALSTCILTIMGIVGERHDWDLKGSEARVEKTMTLEAPRRIAQLTVWVSLPAHLDAQQRAVLQRAGEQCPVKRSLEGAINMELHWT